MAYNPDGSPLTEPTQSVQVPGGGKVQMLDVTADPLLDGPLHRAIHARARRAITS